MSFYSGLRRSGGFTAVEAVVLILVVIVILALVVAALLPLLGSTRGGPGARYMQNASQLRGIHQGLMIYAQGNKSGGGDGWYPGLDARGELITELPEGLEDDVQPGDPAVMMKLLLDGEFISSEYAINPADKHRVPWESSLPFGSRHFSYAALSIMGTDGAKEEWRETLNSSAVILTDRAIGTGSEDITSVWSEDPGHYRGAMTRNDGSTSFETEAIQKDTRYGKDSPVNALDDVFADAPGVADAFLVHEDGRTAYSAD